MLSEDLINILACPRCKGNLEYVKDKDILVCRKCNIFFEIREGIPILLPDAGKPLKE